MRFGKNAQAIALMIFAVFCFYVGDSLTRIAASKIDVLPTLLVRVSFGWLVLLFSSLYFDKSTLILSLKDGFVVLRSLAYFVTIISFAESFAEKADMTSVYMISFLWPLIVIIINKLWYKKNAGSFVISTNIFMFFGIAVYLSSNIFASSGTFVFNASSVIPVSTALGYASIVIIGNKIDKKFSALSKGFSAFSYALVGLIASSIVSFYVHGFHDLDNISIAQAIIAGGCSTAGFIAFTQAMTLGEESRIAPFDYSVLVFSTAWEAFNGVGPTKLQVIGLLIILVGAAALSLIKNRNISDIFLLTSSFKGIFNAKGYFKKSE